MKEEEVTPLYTPRPGLLRYKGYIWRGNKQIDIVKRFYGTRSPMHGPRLRPSLNSRARRDWERIQTGSLIDRQFRGRFKLANRSRLTSYLSDYPILYATACQLFMTVFPIASLREEAGETVIHTVVASLSNVSYLELLRFNSSKNELSRWRLISVDMSFVSRCDNLPLRRRLMFISRRIPSRFLFFERSARRSDDMGIFPALVL